MDEASPASGCETSAAAAEDENPQQVCGDYSIVVMTSRLPVDPVEGPGGESEWGPRPGGLVTALDPVMRAADAAWIGWQGAAGAAPGPFDADGMHLVSVGLSAAEARDHYEGFRNATLWPLDHDVIVVQDFRRPRPHRARRQTHPGQRHAAPGGSRAGDQEGAPQMAKWNFVAMSQVGLTGWTKELAPVAHSIARRTGRPEGQILSLRRSQAKVLRGES